MTTMRFLIAALCIIALTGASAGAATYEFPGLEELDNIEEYVADGSWDAGSSDLEIGYENPGNADQRQQIVGLRFPNIVIPNDEIIIGAYIQFTTDEDKNDNPFSATVYGEATADAPLFAAATHSVSSRTKTAASVDWTDVPDWTSEDERGEAQRTPDLVPIISEIMENGFAYGNAMAFIVEATGTRTAVSYRKAAGLGVGYENFCPTLVVITDTSTVSYQPLSSEDDAEEGDDGAGVLDITSSDLEITMDHENDPSRNQTVGIRFRNVSIPQGTEIVSAYIQFDVDEDDKNADPFNVTITGEATADSEAFTSSLYNISSRARTGAYASWVDIPMWDQGNHVHGEDQRTPDLSGIVQEIVDLEDWSGGNSMTFIFEGTGQRTAESFDGAGDNTERRPTLVVKFAGQEELDIPSVEKVRAMWNDDPATTMVIGWNQIAGANPVLKWGPVDRGDSASAYPNTLAPYKENTVLDMHTYFAKFTGLTPDTYYYFVIQDSEGASDRYYFLTAPDTQQPFTCIIGGDTKNSGNAYTAAQFSNEMVSKLRPLFVQFNGDYCSDNGTNPSYWNDWLNNWSEQTTTDDGRLIPHIAVHGNHENGNYEVLHQLFDTPATNGDPYDYYALTFAGNLLKTFVLNSELQNGSTWAEAFDRQNQWLASELEASGDVEFLVSGYHKPLRPHTSGKSENPTLIAAWADLFYNYGMDISTDADSHMVKYTFPLAPCDDSDPECYESFKKDEENGIFFFGEGSWGAGPRSNDDDKPWTLYSGSFYQFKWLHVYPAAGEEPAHIDVRTIVTGTLEGGTTVSHVENVEDLTEANKYTAIPDGINVLDVPSFGEVIKIPFTLNEYEAALPEAPENLAGVATSYTEIELTWTYTSEVAASAFELEYKTGDGDWTVIDSNISASATRTTLAQLQDGTDYIFRMRARNLFGYSGYTAEVTVSTEKDPTYKVELRQGLDGYDGTVDLELRSWDPDTVVADNDSISVDMSDGGGVNHGMMRFRGLADYIPEGANVISAELQVRTNNPSSGTQSFYRMLVDWPDATSWNTLGGDGVTPDGVEATAEPEGSATSPSSGEYTYIDVTDSVFAWLNGEPNYGWGIINSATDGWDFNTSEYSDESMRPKLTIYYIARGDLNEDGFIDRDDVNLVKGFLRQPASACPECDIDGDGAITVRDARKLVNMCTCSRCACP
jgi:hypothetical protein